MSDRTTFLSAMTVRSIVLALRAVLSPSVLWQTLRCGLPADMVLQKRPTRFAKTNNPKVFLLGQKFEHYNSSKWDLSKSTDRKYHPVVPKILPQIVSTQ
jgi:hypothetical protein